MHDLLNKKVIRFFNYLHVGLTKKLPVFLEELYWFLLLSHLINVLCLRKKKTVHLDYFLMQILLVKHKFYLCDLRVELFVLFIKLRITCHGILGSVPNR